MFLQIVRIVHGIVEDFFPENVSLEFHTRQRRVRGIIINIVIARISVLWENHGWQKDLICVLVH